MSRDYDALYDLLCAGGEALGYVWPFGKGQFRASVELWSNGLSVCIKYPDEEDDWHYFDCERRESFIDGRPCGLKDFIAECTRLNLEWLAPVDLDGVLEAGDAMANSIDEHIEQHVGSTKTPFGTDQDMGHARSEWTDATAKFRKQP